jgi:peptidoglycan hydrolase-like protein with peptidoglycan-binding domain
MRILQRGCTGPDVESWQYFLLGEGQWRITGGGAFVCDGTFGPETDRRTRRFQRFEHLLEDGKVGNQTLGAALRAGYSLLPEPPDVEPARPSFTAMPQAACENFYGRPGFKPAGNGNVTIDPAWINTHLLEIEIPVQDSSSKMLVHKLAAQRFVAMFENWRAADLLGRIVTVDGTFVSRYKRGSLTELSRHSWGLAIDLNASQNLQGHVAAHIGQVGCVRELVPGAIAAGFFWGGHFHNQDPMHFEVALPPQ